MSAPLMPSPLDYVGRRRFAFYPAIRNVATNEWLLGGGSWSEFQVVNAATGIEVWVPRQYLGAVSETHEPVLVVGLTKQLELRGDNLEPVVKRVIEMRPLHQTTANPFLDTRRMPGPATVVGIRLEQNDDSSTTRAAVAALCIGALLLAAIIAIAARV